MMRLPCCLLSIADPSINKSHAGPFMHRRARLLKAEGMTDAAAAAVAVEEVSKHLTYLCTCPSQI